MMKVIYVRVPKINGAPSNGKIGSCELQVIVPPQKAHDSRAKLNGHESLECDKIWKFPYNNLKDQSLILRLFETSPMNHEIARLAILLSWIPMNTTISETFPLRPLIAAIFTPIAFVEIQISDQSVIPFTCPPGDIMVTPAWRPYPKAEFPKQVFNPFDDQSVTLLFKNETPDNEKVHNMNENNEIGNNNENPDKNENQNEHENNANDNSNNNDDCDELLKRNVPLKRKRSSSFHLLPSPKLDGIPSVSSTGSGSNSCDEDDFENEILENFHLFVPPIMKPGLEPGRLEPKHYEVEDLFHIFKQQAYVGGILNGQYINPPRNITKNTPLNEKIHKSKESVKKGHKSSKKHDNSDHHHHHDHHKHSHKDKTHDGNHSRNMKVYARASSIDYSSAEPKRRTLFDQIRSKKITSNMYEQL